MRKYLLLFLLSIILFNCSYLYKGTIVNKYIDKAYYDIRVSDNESTDCVWYDEDGNCSVEVTTYNGTYFNEYLYEPLYIIEVQGYPKKSEKLLKLVFIVSEFEYNNLNKNDYIQLKNKDKFFENYIYTEKGWYYRKSNKTNETYIKGPNKHNNINIFENTYKKDWMSKRGEWK
jgi:hypothetical protein